MFFRLKEKKEVHITALGGIDRVGGANCYLLETPKLRMLIDCGCALIPLSGALFEEDLTEFSYPDFSRIEKKGIDMVLLSHAHFDHIGALPMLIKKLRGQKLQIVASELTLRTIRRSFYDFYREFRQFPFETVRVYPGKPIKYGESSILPVEVPHSVPQSMGFYLEIPGKKIFYPGDFKVNDAEESKTDSFKKTISDLAQRKTDILFLDSSNIYEDGFTLSDRLVWQELERIFSETKGRIIFTTFSSHLARLKAVIQIAESQKRPVYAAGRNLIAFLKAGEIRGWKRFNSHNRFESRVLILTTGCEAEAESGLVNAVFGEAPFRLSFGDTVIISADPIPIPEIENRVREMVRRLTKITKKVYISAEAPDDFSPKAQRANIHVSGHGKKEDLLYLVRELRPKLVIPVHGDVGKRQCLANLIKKEGVETKIIETNVPFEV